MQEGSKKEPEFVFCYWDEFNPNVEENDNSSIPKKQDSEEDVHDGVRERTNPGSNNQCKRKKASDSE